MSVITRLFPCNVECISSTKYGDRPTAVVFENARLPIIDILKHWRSPGAVVFHVLTKNDLAFEVTYHEDSDQWSCRTI